MRGRTVDVTIVFNTQATLGPIRVPEVGASGGHGWHDLRDDFRRFQAGEDDGQHYYRFGTASAATAEIFINFHKVDCLLANFKKTKLKAGGE